MRVIAGLALLLVCSVCESTQAATGIRVMLAQDLARVSFKAEGAVAVRSGRSEWRAVAAPLVVSAVPGGMVLNQEAVSAEAIHLKGGQGDIQVLLTDGDTAGMRVGGVVSLLRKGRGLMVINELDLEDYVEGVVPHEMNAAWHPEALKGQAVLARTYALYQRMANPAREYDVMATVQDQVYRGRQGVDHRIKQAVEDTRGVILTYRNLPVLSAFFSTAAGFTEDAMAVWSKDLPYLKGGVDCPFDAASPHFQWRAAFKLQDLENGLRRQGFPVGTIATFAPLAYSRAGRVARIRVLHSEGELILRGEDLRKAIGYSLVPSTQFDIDAIGREVVLVGRGAGHGVGLCQWGAKELAALGYPYQAILRYYFPGTELMYLKDTSLPG